MNWRIEEEGFHPEQITSNGNKYLVGNGYMGLRGTLPEYEREECVAVNLAGIYDKVGDGWREPLNAPNGLYTYIELGGTAYRLPEVTPLEHHLALNYRHGVFECNTIWETHAGKLKIRAERFASMEDKHLICMKYNFSVEKDTEAVLYTGIDGMVWDINGPHYDEIRSDIDTKSNMDCSETGLLLRMIGITHESKEQVCVYEAIDTDTPATVKIIREDRRLLRKLTISMKADTEYSLYKYISVYTSRDHVMSKVSSPGKNFIEDVACDRSLNYIDEAKMLVLKAGRVGYELALRQHTDCWERLWNISEVKIDGDDEAMEALNYSIYHLHCIAPRHTDHLSIAARGLSGQTYKGAVFWDTEMFMLDFFLYTEPTVAKTLLKYRIDTLEGAKKKAIHYGYQGAFYAWESQEGGYDACSDYNVTDVFTGRQMRTYFKDKQIHISSAIVHGIMRYTNYTGSNELLAEGGAEVILECARFYYDLLVRRVNREHYELRDVIGPDEYHERVSNNAYTNRMAKFTFDSAVQLLTQELTKDNRLKERIARGYDIEALLKQFRDASDKLYIPEPDKVSKVIEQFDGYFGLEEVSIDELKGRLLHEKEYWGGAYGIATHTKVIKQADVVTMLNLFSQDYEAATLQQNWEYYEPRTEHGSSLSACMYAILACKCNMPDKAYPFFMKSALSDLRGKGKEWAGLIYIGGTHPASSGGAYMTAIEGFAGLHQEDGILKAKACLPSGWRSMCFQVIFREELYQIEITGEDSKIVNLGRPA
ncbi:MAG: Kojibiose phosphorylase [Herbinix sp.]|nr:Kojibiose phosphorylase [Herbinix sp.]